MKGNETVRDENEIMMVDCVNVTSQACSLTTKPKAIVYMRDSCKKNVFLKIRSMMNVKWVTLQIHTNISWRICKCCAFTADFKMRRNNNHREKNHLTHQVCMFLFVFR